MMRTEKKLILSSYFTTDWHLFCWLSAPTYYEQVFEMIILFCPYMINTSLQLLYSFYTYLDYSKEKSINIASSGKGLDSQLTLGQCRHLAVMFLGATQEWYIFLKFLQGWNRMKKLIFLSCYDSIQVPCNDQERWYFEHSESELQVISKTCKKLFLTLIISVSGFLKTTNQPTIYHRQPTNQPTNQPTADQHTTK